jgi:hypothetical protein
VVHSRRVAIHRFRDGESVSCSSIDQRIGRHGFSFAGRSLPRSSIRLIGDAAAAWCRMCRCEPWPGVSDGACRLSIS